MATLDDKILGEKVHCYCSSSESEEEKSEDESETNVPTDAGACAPTDIPLPDPYKWEGYSTNTGPKGVVQDWRRYKQLENEKRAEQEKERLELIKKLSLTCRSALDEERDKNAEELDPELAELLNDENILLEYQKQRMQEMLQQISSLPKFGKVITLTNGEEFLDAIDKEHKSVSIVVHIYEDGVPACEAMNGCLLNLCQEYVNVKFCKVIGSAAGVSKRFKINGVPALLIYKAGQLVGNFVRVSEELGEDFFMEDVESFLLQHGMLPDKSCVPAIIRQQPEDDDNSSDLSLE